MSRSRISDVLAWEAMDSRGNPTVGCRVRLAGGAEGIATVPSGASTGSHEARELRDGGERYAGLGVADAVSNVKEFLGPAVIGMDVASLDRVDAALEEIDGTPDLRRLGANAVLAVSIASWLAAADAEQIPLYASLDSREPLLPMPMVNIISGGAHAVGGVDLQDFLVIPVGATSFAQAIEWAWMVRQSVGVLVAERGLSPSLVADEGGLGPPLESNSEALDLLLLGIERAGLEPQSEVAIAVDVAATRLRFEGGYHLASEGRKVSVSEWLAELEEWSRRYPIVSLEDPFAEDDWDAWRAITHKLGPSLQLIGDDLFATRLQRLERGIEERAANSILVKPNQAGSLSRAQEALKRAAEAGYATVVSARSGDTEDSWLADLAVGWRAGQIKVGSTARSERTSKWNRLLMIEAELEGACALASWPPNDGKT